MKKITPIGFIAIIVIIACIAWCFVYPLEKEAAIGVGAAVFFFGLFFGGYSSDD